MKLLLVLLFGLLFFTILQESFAEEHNHANTFDLKINQTSNPYDDLKITFQSVIEDSRCPSDVTCIWEGRVTGMFLVDSTVVELTPTTNNTIAWNNYTIHLENISPYPSSNEKIIPQDYVASITVEKSRYDSPLKQAKAGVESSKISCNVGREPIMKKISGQIACIKSSSIEKLISRGWAIHVLPDYQKDASTNSEIFSTGSYQVEGDMISYFQNVKGFLAKPTSGTNFPQIVMIHEWWGLNDNIKDMAKKLASHGYIVLAVDLYDGNVATTSDQARQLINSFNSENGITNMNAAVSYLQTNFGNNKIGSIGWCFGGGQSLNLALSNTDMDATVMYYGQLVTDSEKLSKIKWPLLGIFAANDKGILVDSVKQFKSELDELHISNNIIIYPGVDHAFANPSGASYSPNASQDAWSHTIQFLDTNLK